MAREKIAEKNVAEDMSGVTIAFTNGNKLTVNLADLQPEIVTHLALHGLSQKLGDSYSGEKDLEVALAKAQGVAQRLADGNWKAVREGGGSRITDLAQALAAVTGREIGEAVALIENMDKGQKSDLRKHAQIKAKLAEIAAERAAKAAQAAEASEDADLGAMFG